MTNQPPQFSAEFLSAYPAFRYDSSIIAEKCFDVWQKAIQSAEQIRWNALEDAYRAVDAVLPHREDGSPRSGGSVKVDAMNAISALQCAKPAAVIKDCLITDGWIEWNGGKCLCSSAVVDVTLRDKSVMTDLAGNLRWAHCAQIYDRDADIIAYRFRKESPTDWSAA